MHYRSRLHAGTLPMSSQNLEPKREIRPSHQTDAPCHLAKERTLEARTPGLMPPKSDRSG